MKVINVDYRREGNSWWAESKDVPGFTAVSQSFSELRKMSIEGLEFYLDGEDITVVEFIDGAQIATRWTATGALYITQAGSKQVGVARIPAANRDQLIPA